MKRRDFQPVLDPKTGLDGPSGLLQALASLRQPVEVAAFLQDLCTPAELEAMADRWRVVPLLLAEIPYREIHERTGVSVTTIGRVARCLAGGAGGYSRAAQNLKLHPRRGAPSASH